jgi:hypothetical protein
MMSEWSGIGVGGGWGDGSGGRLWADPPAARMTLTAGVLRRRGLPHGSVGSTLGHYAHMPDVSLAAGVIAAASDVVLAA